jgi:Holliday junction resolvase
VGEAGGIREVNRHARKVDANQGEIVSVLEAIGVQVFDLSASGDGVPDLLCAFRGRLALIEVKNLDGRGNKLTIPQVRFHEKMRLAAVRIHVVTNPSEALAVFGARLAA